MKNIILFDLDGTLADCQHRIHHITEGKKNWKEFFKACPLDAPIKHAIMVLNALSANGYSIYITSGRSDEVRVETEVWLSHNNVYYDRLIMRKAGDYTDDGLLKPSWLTDGTIPKENVLCAFDDRARVVKAWRAAGIPCFQVADGDF